MADEAQKFSRKCPRKCIHQLHLSAHSSSTPSPTSSSSLPPLSPHVGIWASNATTYTHPGPVHGRYRPGFTQPT